MLAREQHNWRYFGGALFIHALIALLFIGIALHAPQVVVPQLAIKATLVDRDSLNPPAKAPEPAVKPDQPQQEQEAREAQQKQQAEKQRAEEQAQEKTKEHELELKQAADAQQEAQRKAAAEAQRQKQEADKKRVAEIQQKQREVEQKRQAEMDAKVQAAREAELKSQLADEEGRMQAVNAGLQDQYNAMIQQKIIRSWLKPPSASIGVDCDVTVTQTIGGTVLNAEVGRCNGDAAVKQSVENAVRSASPLPLPSDMRLFHRSFTLRFKPLE